MKIDLSRFSDKKEAIKYLVSNKQELIEMKKSVHKKTDLFGVPTEYTTSLKAFSSSKDTDTDINRTIIGSTYYWMDSYDDVHLENVFSKSLKERKSKVPHLHDHLFEITAKVGIPKDIYEKFIDWKDLGVNKKGQTQSLFLDSNIQKELNSQIFKGYLNDEINQHSVYMQYVQMDLAINDEEYKEEYRRWKEVFPLIGNPDTAKENGFFWAIKEARLIEISCVLEGSNELTQTLIPKSTDAQPVLTTVVQSQSFDISAAIQKTKFFK